ncbi:Nif3-like dinuclear metal center hexameric protein [Bombilactobacillus folatiphilus]|uniref:GTP cyclohydrolase 1 type 2 homolog n=1 Tax=Bombilactobacillus folatiphilus TaxID=2923362 RepID=A0ABY4P799_9LACO|nr:Nif3-like dinuclear metal center hexameric protein [Bombilactobacillus folatiphilus]UQS81512.1 Nif3-like dinuclear metal center hexameric protein [Bombilactobacillus folatiphilus]
MITGQELVQRIEKFSPLSLKMHDDPTGLQVGGLLQPVHRVLTTLDVRPEVVQEAIELKADFILAHHPLMFHPAKNLDISVPQNQMYADLLTHQITVYAAHTNLDRAPVGMNDWLAQSLDLQNIQPFNFDEQQIALGRFGSLPKSLTIQALAQKLKQVWQLSGVRVIAHDLADSVRTVGIIGGDGSKFYPEALKVPLDLLITGDVYYHTGHDLLANHLPVIDPGHHVESIFKYEMKKLLDQWNEECPFFQLTVMASQCNTDPFTFL